jgi:hypothetical protein
LALHWPALKHPHLLVTQVTKLYLKIFSMLDISTKANSLKLHNLVVLVGRTTSKNISVMQVLITPDMQKIKFLPKL